MEELKQRLIQLADEYQLAVAQNEEEGMLNSFKEDCDEIAEDYGIPSNEVLDWVMLGEESVDEFVAQFE